jgi:glycosyltransferase involved in cell wall biosynthesis
MSAHGGEGVNKRVCFVRMNYFPEEAHVRKNAEALIAAGYEVDVICLRDKGERAKETVKGVSVHRLPLMHKRTSALRYVFEYAAFFGMASWLLTWLHLRRRYSIVEAYNVPDAIVFVALVPRLLGARVVLYMFEATPEMYVDRFELRPGGFVEKLLRWQERISARFAHRAIVEGPHEREIRGERGVDASKISVVMNVPESHLFQPKGQPKGQPNGGTAGGSYEIITHGSLLKRYGIQTLIEAVPFIRREIPNLKVWVVGDGEYRGDLEALAKQTGVTDCVEFTGWVKHEQVAGYIDRCQAGIVPMLYNQLPNKLFEYVAMGVPTVVGEVPSIRRAFADHEVLYYKTGDARQLAEGVIRIHGDPRAAAEMAARAQKTFRKYTWDIMRDVYVGIHDDVLTPPQRSSERTESVSR